MRLNALKYYVLSQLAGVLAFGLKPHVKPLFDPLVNLQPELFAVP